MHSPVRRLVVMIAGAAIVLAGGGFAVALTLKPDAFEDKAVPWVDAPVARPMRPESSDELASPRAAAEPCVAKDLDVLWPEGGWTFSDPTQGRDSTGITVLVRNIGAAPCTLAGHPKTQGLDRKGEPLGSPAQHGTYLAGTDMGESPATIAPGEPAKFYVSISSQDCDGEQIEYRGAKVLLDNGFKFSIRNAWLRGSCPLRVSPWGLAASNPKRFWALEARLVTPPSAEAGTDLTYVVELINVTDSTVTMAPCPVYTQVLTPDDSFEVSKINENLHTTHRLNCAPSTIGPKAVVRYQMKIPIPHDFPPGKTHVFWMAEDHMHPAAGSDLTVTQK